MKKALALILALACSPALASDSCPQGASGEDARAVGIAVEKAEVGAAFNDYENEAAAKIVGKLGYVLENPPEPDKIDRIMTISRADGAVTKVAFLKDDCMVAVMSFDPKKWDAMIREALGPKA